MINCSPEPRTSMLRLRFVARRFVTTKRVSKKRVSEKRVSEKRVSEKRESLRRRGTHTIALTAMTTCGLGLPITALAQTGQSSSASAQPTQAAASQGVQTASVTPVTAVLVVTASGQASAPTAAAGVPSSVVVAARVAYSDGIADTARAALDSFQERGRPGVIAGSAPATPSTLLVTTQSPAALTVSAIPTVSQPPRLAGSVVGESWTSAVIDTADVASFVFGTPIETVANPTTAKALGALPTEPSARYSGALRQLAELVEARTKVDADRLYAVWLATDERRMKAILTAMAQVGTQYRYTGNKPGGFDCSGLTSYAWSQAGVKMPRVSTEQISWAVPKTFEQLLPGDLIWRPGHIGLYLGVGDAMVHSPQTGKTVEVRKIGKSNRFGGVLEKAG